MTMQKGVEIALTLLISFLTGGLMGYNIKSPSLDLSIAAVVGQLMTLYLLINIC
jgi:hypothetical protein